MEDQEQPKYDPSKNKKVYLSVKKRIKLKSKLL